MISFKTYMSHRKYKYMFTKFEPYKSFLFCSTVFTFAGEVQSSLAVRSFRYKPQARRYISELCDGTMAVWLNCGEVQPYASMWGSNDLGQMGEAVVLEEVHQHPLQWNAKNEADTAEGKKYMFCGLTNAEYNLCRADDGTVHRTDHSGHNTGFTSWHCSMHDCITYMLWCNYHVGRCAVHG